MTEAYPLSWPDGWPRTPEHQRIDGRRIIEAESMERFLGAMSDPDAPTMGPEEIAELARAMGR